MPFLDLFLGNYYLAEGAGLKHSAVNRFCALPKDISYGTALIKQQKFLL